MAKMCSIRQFLCCCFAIFCIVMIYTTDALLRYRLQTSDSRLFPGRSKPLQNTESTTSDPVASEAPQIHHKPHAYQPPTTAPGSDYGLSHEECRNKFAGLFDELDRSAALRKELGNVSLADIDSSWKPDGVVRVMIYNNKLYVIDSKFDDKGYQRPRALATLQQINRAITLSPSPLPLIEFSFQVDDIADETHYHQNLWSYTRHAYLDKGMWVMPDFGYWSWPLDLVGEYQQIRSDMQAGEVAWENKIPKVLWRGAVATNRDVRGALISAAKGKPWADVDEVSWKSRSAVTAGSPTLPIADHCKYQFLAYTEGHSYSGRGKYLLNCASVMITHKVEWVEPHSHLYITSGPNQNVIEVERDFSDLEAKVQELLRNPERAKAIVKNSVATFRDRYLTPAAEVCYWRELFFSWANVSFQPDPWEVDEDGNDRIRGVPFETFIIQVLDPDHVPDQCSWWKKIIGRC